MFIFKKVFKNCSKVVSVVLCLIIISFIGSFFDASANTGNVPADSIYYFMDYYPSIDYETLNSEYGTNHNIIFDRQKLNEDKFYDLIDNNYFTNFDEDVTFILDLKTFCPDSNELYNLFHNLKNNYNCNIIFITLYDSSYFNLYLLNDVDKLCFNADLWDLNTFVKESFMDLDYINHPYTNTDYLIDGNMINIDDYYGASLEELASHSPFLNALLLELFTNFKRDFDEYNDTDFDYNTIYDLIFNNDIRILVHTSQRDFVDIIDWEEYTDASASSLLNFTTVVTINPDGTHSTIIDFEDEVRYLVSFVFLSFDSDLYNFLYEIQNDYDFYMPVYGYIIDEVVYDPYGLFVKTDNYLLPAYGGYIQIERVIDGEVTYIEILEEDYVNETKADVLDYLGTIF